MNEVMRSGGLEVLSAPVLNGRAGRLRLPLNRDPGSAWTQLFMAPGGFSTDFPPGAARVVGAAIEFEAREREVERRVRTIESWMANDPRWSIWVFRFYGRTRAWVATTAVGAGDGVPPPWSAALPWRPTGSVG